MSASNYQYHFQEENKIFENNANKRKFELDASFGAFHYNNIPPVTNNAIFEHYDFYNKKVKKSDVDHEYFTLYSGEKIPKVQFGTYKMKGEDCYQGVLSALKMGYKGLDTASIYCNEDEVGR